MNEEIGKRYGRLVVVGKTDKRYHTCIIYKCLCDCGNYTEVNVNKLHMGHTKSCGCLKNSIKNDFTGKRFGRLKVLEFAYRKNNYTYWKCICDCGKECYVTSNNLITGASVSCGCKNEENKKNVFKYNKTFKDGTMVSAIDGNRKINKNNSSGHVGIYYDKQRKKWVAQITFQRKNHSLGRFDTMEEAIQARTEAEELYFGKYR